MITFLHDKARLEAYLRRSPALRVYYLGDLDDFFWPYTQWFADEEGGEIRALMLLYNGAGSPVILAECQDGEPRERLSGLVTRCLPLLPRRFYSHLTPGLVDLLRPHYALEPHGAYLKMALADPARAGDAAADGVQPLGPEHAGEVTAFYARAYPGNWFDPRMLETGCYWAIRREGALVCVAGVHVYSPQYRAAALGNITTLPEFRGQGLATAATARAMRALLERGIETIGLNVRADNLPAIACYRRLGFVPVAEYEEWQVG